MCWNFILQTHCPLCQEYYETYLFHVLGNTTWDRVILVTGSSNDPLTKKIVNRFQAKLVAGSMISDFYIISMAKKVVLTPSTVSWIIVCQSATWISIAECLIFRVQFSWWAAWLGDATEIHFPGKRERMVGSCLVSMNILEFISAVCPSIGKRNFYRSFWLASLSLTITARETNGG